MGLGCWAGEPGGMRLLAEGITRNCQGLDWRNRSNKNILCISAGLWLQVGSPNRLRSDLNIIRPNSWSLPTAEGDCPMNNS